jgi:exonuclease VII small subunit
MDVDEILKQILGKLESLEEGQRSLEQGQRSLEEGQRSLEQGQRSLEEGQRELGDRLESKIDWAVAELKMNDNSTLKLMDGFYTRYDETEKIQSEIKELKIRLFDIEQKVRKL